jgi:hypothetical protein
MPDIHRLTRDQRTADLYFHVDPCFVNLRKCGSICGPAFIDPYKDRAELSSSWPMAVFNDHLAVDLVMQWCRDQHVSTLAERLIAPQVGDVFCSIEKIRGKEDVYDDERVTVPIAVPYESDLQIEMEFGTKHIVCDTGRVLLSRESDLALIGEIHAVDGCRVLIHPLIMGSPTFYHARNTDRTLAGRVSWYARDFYDTLPEDIDEFSALSSVDEPQPEEWTERMKNLKENDVKSKFCELLRDLPQNDWGGEQEDHFTASVHVGGKRTMAAFLFKGPSQFREMTPRLLGRQGDQIYRLANTPARLLIVQHCHLIGKAVRETLRAFAVAAHSPRRYCVIDGKQTYRLFKAYGKL